MTDVRLFGTDGVRGRYGTDPITKSMSSKLGFCFAKLLSEEYENNNIVIARDTRISGPSLESSLASGVVKAGLTPILCGILSTPALAYLISSGDYAGGVMISASHNPYFDNGFKFFGPNGEKVNQNEIGRIEASVSDLKEPFIPAYSLDKKLKFIDGASFYLGATVSTKKFFSTKVILDCANGSLSQIAERFFQSRCSELTVMGKTPNGFNINHMCGSTNIVHLREEVLKRKADVGFAFDGDGDRLIAVDGSGVVIDGDDILYILAKEQKRKSTLVGGVVGTGMSNVGLENALMDLGIPFRRTSVGDQNIIKALRELKWSIGGEPSGHIILKKTKASGDGLICAEILLEIMETSGLGLLQLTKGLTKKHQEILNIKTPNKYEIFNEPALKNTIHKIESDLDQNSRILVRPSGTEPKIRLLVESDDQELRSFILKTLIDKIHLLNNSA